MSQAPSTILVPLDLNPGPSAVNYAADGLCPILGFMCQVSATGGTVKLTPLRSTEVQIGGSGTGARLRITCGATGAITGVEVAAGGTGYGTGTLVTVLVDPYGTGGSITATAVGGTVTGASVISPGYNYSGYTTWASDDFIEGVNYNVIPRFIEMTAGSPTLIKLVGNRLSYRPYQVF